MDLDSLKSNIGDKSTEELLREVSEIRARRRNYTQERNEEKRKKATKKKIDQLSLEDLKALRDKMEEQGL